MKNINNSPILKAAFVQVLLVGIASLVLIVGMTFSSNKENINKVDSIFKNLEDSINQEIFINSQINAKNDNSIHQLNILRTQAKSNKIDVHVWVTPCSSSVNSDIQYKLTAVENKCLNVSILNESFMNSLKQVLLIVLFIILISLPIYHYFTKEMLNRGKLESRSELANEVVHAVGGPLARLNLVTESIQHQIDPEDFNCLKSAYDDLEYQVMKLSHKEQKRSLNAVTTDLTSLIDLVVNFKSNEADIKGLVTFEKNYDQSAGLYCDIYPRRFRELLDNLINNSIFAVKDVVEPKIIISMKAKDGYMSFSLKDNGIGIKQNDMSKVFEKEFSTKEKRNTSGFGLGLFQTRKEVLKLNGTINIESKEGEGTEVVINLPLSEFTSTSTTKEIILIDDDTFLINTAKTVFESLGYVCKVFTSPEKFLSNNLNDFKESLVLYDMRFDNSDMTGLELRSRLLSSGFEAKNLILISSLAQNISSQAKEKILGVSKQNFSDVIGLVKRVNPVC